MKHLNLNTVLKIMTVVLVALTPLFVILDTHRLGYVPMNGAWFTWVIPAIVLFDRENV